jgi:ketosteroid isomerase-like protein
VSSNLEGPAVSRENEKIAKRAFDAYNGRDLDAYDELYTPDYEWFPALVGIIDGESFRGREGIARYYEILSDIWEEFRVEGEEFRDAGDSLVVRIRIEARGKGSGVPVVARQTLICDFRAGRISRVRSYLDHGEALRIAGLAV